MTMKMPDPNPSIPDPEQWKSDWSNLTYLDQSPPLSTDRPPTDLRIRTVALAAFLSVGIVLVLAFIAFMASMVRSLHG